MGITRDEGAMSSRAEEFTPSRVTASHLIAFSARLPAFLLIWFVLTEGDFYQWWFGLVACGVAAAVSVAMVPPLSHWMSILGVVRFIPFFLIQAVLGGLDVGRRTVHPRLLIQPAFFEHRLRLSYPPAQLFFICVVSLLPGTVACRLREQTITIHVLDRSMNVAPFLAKLEHHTSSIFRLELPPAVSEGGTRC